MNGMGGRPTDLTPETQAIILEVLRKGNYRNVAARKAGITPRTFAGWMRRGEDESEGVYSKFFHAVLEVEQDVEIAAVDGLLTAGKQDAKFLMEYLSRKFPKRWGRNRVELKMVEERIKVLEAKLGADALR